MWQEQCSSQETNSFHLSQRLKSFWDRMQNEAKLFSKIKEGIYIVNFHYSKKVNSRVLQGTIQGPGVQNVLINVEKKSEQQHGKICR